MTRYDIITAACIALGSVSIAVAVNADPVCDAGADIARSALEMRFMGLSEGTAQAIVQESILHGAGTLPEEVRVAFVLSMAPVLGDVVSVMYAVPIDRSGDPVEQVADMTNAFLDGCEGR